MIGRAPYSLAHLAEAKSTLSRRLLLVGPSDMGGMAASRILTAAPQINVHGVGVGYKVVSGRTTAEPAIKIYVRKKHPKAQIGANEMLPSTLDGLQTDVEEVGFLQPLAAWPGPRLRLRPAQPGCSTGVENNSTREAIAGTFGALVYDNLGTYILSNNHVLADQNRLPFGSSIFEPSPYDGGSLKRDKIAVLDGYVPLIVGAPNYVDGAIGKLLHPDLAVSDILDIGSPTGVKSAEVDTIVEKFGRTTGYTKGYVSSVSADIKLPYDIGTLLFHDQIAITSIEGGAFSDLGDSGSLVLERASGSAVGLLFAGGATISFANHMADVLDAFGVTLVTG